MAEENYILVKQYCERTRIPDAFINALNDYDLIRCKRIETEVYILDEEIPEIERFNRLHRDLGINLEGIDALNHMLEKIQRMDRELSQLRNRLRVYEK